MADKVYVSWEEIKAACQALVTVLTEKGVLGRTKGLVVVLSGGMIPAYWVRKMVEVQEGIKLDVRVADLQSYTYDQQGDMDVRRLPADIGDGTGWIILDEVADTGETFAVLKRRYPEAVFATLTAKPKGKAVADFSVLAFKQTEWIVFPWEIE